MSTKTAEQCSDCAYSRYHGNPIQFFCIKAQTYVLYSGCCPEFFGVCVKPRGVLGGQPGKKPDLS